jgi:hypothetical protein
MAGTSPPIFSKFSSIIGFHSAVGRSLSVFTIKNNIAHGFQSFM